MEIWAPFIHSFTCLLAYLLDVDSSFHLRSSRDHITSVPQIQWFTWTPILLSSIKAKTNTYKIRPNKSLLIIYTEFHWKLESWNYKETISWRFLFQTIVKFSRTECSVKACTEKRKQFSGQDMMSQTNISMTIHAAPSCQNDMKNF